MGVKYKKPILASPAKLKPTQAQTEINVEEVKYMERKLETDENMNVEAVEVVER